MDSAKPPVTRYSEPQGPFPLESVHLPISEEKDSLDRFGGRKFIVGVLLITVASIFTWMGIMTVDQWLWFTSGVGVAYFGVNFIQKKAL